MPRHRRRSVSWPAVAVTVAAVVVLAVAVFGLRSSPPKGAGRVPAASGPTSTVSTPAAPSVVAFLGDSYTQGYQASSNLHRWTTLAAAHFGWVERNFGVGATGYLETSQYGGAYASRVARVAAARPSIVVVAGGRNDCSLPAAAVNAAIGRTFTELRAALPHTRIIAESPVWDSTKPSHALAQIASEVRAAVTSVGGRYVDVGEPLAGKPQDIASDHLHPNDAGYALLAAAFERAYTAG